MYGGRGIAVDGGGNAYVTGGQADERLPHDAGGLTNRSALPIPGSAPTRSCSKLNPQRALRLIWSTYLGGSGGEEGRGIALDGDGNVYVTGLTTSTNFPILDPVQETHGGTGSRSWGDAFVTKLSADGSQVLYSTFLGGSGDDAGFGIAVDPFGTAYVDGRDLCRPTSRPSIRPNRRITARFDAFVFKLSSPPPPDRMALDKTGLRLGAVTTGTTFVTQTLLQVVRMTQQPSGTVTWTATSSDRGSM